MKSKFLKAPDSSRVFNQDPSHVSVSDKSTGVGVTHGSRRRILLTRLVLLHLEFQRADFISASCDIWSCQIIGV